jgi:hypothetical protein
MALNGTPNGHHSGKGPLGPGADDRLIVALLAGDTYEQAARKVP